LTGVLYGIVNSVNSVGGFLSPLLVELLTSGQVCKHCRGMSLDTLSHNQNNNVLHEVEIFPKPWCTRA